MTEILYPSPQTTLVVLLGASEFPQSPVFKPSEAFANSAKDLEVYFLSTFQLPKDNLLNLFNAEESPPDLEKRIGNFLKTRMAELKQSRFEARDAIFYYVGHGGFTKSNRYHLPIRYTQDPGPLSSKLEMESLAHTIKENTRSLRRILILDCCFAATAVQYQSAAPEVAFRQTIQVFEEKDKGRGLPTQGTSLLCSSNNSDVSITFSNAKYTTFSEALLFILNHGDIHVQNHFSLHTLRRLTDDFLFKKYQNQVPRPEVHSPDQSDGDVASVPFFPNPHPQKVSVSATLPKNLDEDDRAISRTQPHTQPAEKPFRESRNEQISLVPEVDEIDPVPLHPAPPESSFQELYRAGVLAKAEGNLEQATVLWQQILDRDPQFQSGALASHMKQLLGDLHIWRLKQLREHAQRAHSAGEWEQEIEAWQALLKIEPYDNQAQKEKTLAEKHQKYAWMYESARQFVKEKALPAAKMQLEMLWKEDYDYGDPADLMDKIKPFPRFWPRYTGIIYAQLGHYHILDVRIATKSGGDITGKMIMGDTVNGLRDWHFAGKVGHDGKLVITCSSYSVSTDPISIDSLVKKGYLKHTRRLEFTGTVESNGEILKGSFVSNEFQMGNVNLLDNGTWDVRRYSSDGEDWVPET